MQHSFPDIGHTDGRFDGKKPLIRAVADYVNTNWADTDIQSIKLFCAKATYKPMATNNKQYDKE